MQQQQQLGGVIITLGSSNIAGVQGFLQPILSIQRHLVTPNHVP